jgi:hypothetical protein
VNLVNHRREFFYVGPAEVKAALLRLRGDLLTFFDTPEALEWHQSEKERRIHPPTNAYGPAGAEPESLGSSQTVG